MPTTNTGIPRAALSVTAWIVPGASGVLSSAAPSMQLGKPSVASRMYLGFGSGSVASYRLAALIAARVGVPPLGCVAAMAVATPAAFMSAIGAAVLLLSPQEFPG